MNQNVVIDVAIIAKNNNNVRNSLHLYYLERKAFLFSIFTKNNVFTRFQTL